MAKNLCTCFSRGFSTVPHQYAPLDVTNIPLYLRRTCYSLLMTFRSYPNGFPQLRPVSPLSTPCRQKRGTSPLSSSNQSIAPTFFGGLQATTTFSPSLLCAYGRIYQNLGGRIQWQGDTPVLNAQLRQHFEQVRQEVTQGARIEQVMKPQHYQWEGSSAKHP